MWQMAYGDWHHRDRLIDDVTLSCYAAPRSYTGQDMVEIFCHGNPIIIEDMLSSLLANGARRARPGEFTMRAVLNGKMSLLQAEGVNALIESHTRYQADMVRRQSKGPLVAFINEQVEEILQIQAHIEATIDYGEEDIDSLDREVLAARIQVLIAQFKDLQKTASFHKAMRRGFQVLITGEPNVGKSTLFNRLVRQERAIVTELPGTTRDLISEQVEIKGLPVILIDSAGVRETEDRIEQAGIQKILEMLHDVDLVVHLTSKDSPKPPYPEVLALPEDKYVLVYTKSDLIDGNEDDELAISAVTGKGIEELENQIVIRLAAGVEDQSMYLINQRQEEVMTAVIEQLENAFNDFRQGFGEEVLSSYLNMARRYLGELTGETSVEDILDRMFSNFCLGK
jgi:tRNA modification GTPase